MDDGRSQEEYIRQAVKAYRKTPGTMGTVRRADRMLAAQLYQRGTSIQVVENAIMSAAARRLMRPADAPPLGTIRSLADCLPVIEEGLGMRVSPDYFPISPPQARPDCASTVAPSSAPAPRTLAADDGKPNPHAYGMDDIACLPSPKPRLRRG
jgi:hypothetical protein